MRSYRLVALLALLGGCSSGQGFSDGGGQSTDSSGAPEAAVVGEVKQKAQFADDTIINLVDPGTATLTLTADVKPVNVQIFYISDKTTNSGHVSGPATLIETISLNADQTKVHNVNLLHSAFAGGYGSLLLSTLGGSKNDVFQTYVNYGGSMFSTGGSVFTGGSYRIPYLSGTSRMVLALTNQSDFSFQLEIENVGGTQFKNITLSPLSTYKFDTIANGWVLTGTSSIQIFTTNGGTVSVSGYIDRILQRTRITPVKAAPFL
jgi:hypothetical protein